jgi:hypothetical protein
LHYSQRLDRLFKLFYQIKVIDLRNNELNCIYEKSFEGISNLKDLLITENRINKIDQRSFQELIYLKVLYLYLYITCL